MTVRKLKICVFAFKFVGMPARLCCVGMYTHASFIVWCAICSLRKWCLISNMCFVCWWLTGILAKSDCGRVIAKYDWGVVMATPSSLKSWVHEKKKKKHL